MIEQELHNWAFENGPILEGWASDGASEGDIFRRVKDMRYTLPIAEWTAEIEEHLKEVVRRAVKLVMDERNGPTGPTPTVNASFTFNYTDNRTTTTNTISDSTNCSIALGTAKPKRVRKPKKVQAVKLHFYLIKDDRLSFDDRIIFSLLCKYTKINKRTKPVKLKTFKRFTGFRQHTIIRSLLTLVSLGYVDTDQIPQITKASVAGKLPTLNNGGKLLGFRKMEWMNNGNVKWQVFNGVMNTNRNARQSTPAWFVKTLGVSKKTASHMVRRKLTWSFETLDVSVLNGLRAVVGTVILNGVWVASTTQAGTPLANQQLTLKQCIIEDISVSPETKSQGKYTVRGHCLATADDTTQLLMVAAA